MLCHGVVCDEMLCYDVACVGAMGCVVVLALCVMFRHVC